MVQIMVQIGKPKALCRHLIMTTFGIFGRPLPSQPAQGLQVKPAGRSLDAQKLPRRKFFQPIPRCFLAIFRFSMFFIVFIILTPPIYIYYILARGGVDG